MTIISTLEKMNHEPFLGDFVQTTKYGYRGRVVDVHYGCPQNRNWILGQGIKLTDDELADKWVSILLHNPSGGAGSAVVPASDCTIIEPFDFQHRDAAQYFRPDTTTAAKAD